MAQSQPGKGRQVEAGASLDAVGWGRGDNASEEALRQGVEVGASLNTAAHGRGGEVSEEARW